MPDGREEDYQRRRADGAVDRHLDRVEKKVDELDAKVDKISTRVAAIVAVLSFVTLIANIIGPVVAIRILQAMGGP